MMPPTAISVDAPLTVSLGECLCVYTNVLEGSGALSVAALVTSGSNRYTWEMPMSLVPDATCTYETAPLVFDETGDWNISVLITDSAGNVSSPETAVVGVMGQAMKGDLNIDGQIDREDLFLFTQCWTSERGVKGPYNNLADYQDDMKVDATDLLRLLEDM